MDYNININKICRVCLEENVLTSIFNTEFAMIPAEMLMLCAKVKVNLRQPMCRNEEQKLIKKQNSFNIEMKWNENVSSNLNIHSS